MDSFNGTRREFNTALIETGAQSLLSQLSRFFSDQHVRGYLVGGFVRDSLLGRDTADIDIAINTDVIDIAPRIAELLHGKFVLLDEINKIGRVILPDWVIDIASFAGNIEDDLKRRDFTIDAMAIDLKQIAKNNQRATLIDPFNGQSDLDLGIIKLVSATVFEDDPARLLRAIRLASELDFAIDRKTETEISRSAALITAVPGERVREELLRLLNTSHGGQVFSEMEKLGLLTALIPELMPLKGVEQPKEHHWDVFEHSINTISAVDFVLHEGVWIHQKKDILSMLPGPAALVAFDC